MLQSKLFTKTRKDISSDEISRNAKLLTQAGFIHKDMAGVYTFLPMGLRVLEKIKNIIREELNKIGALEMVMTTLQAKEIWEKSGRWDDKVVDDWFKTKLKNNTELGLAFTHEEALTNIMTNFISSYKDLPIYAYQFQTKFRNELRAKSGIMRGREFVMKDLYDFSLDEKQHKDFYEKMKEVYMNIFIKVGIGDKTYLTMSSGGTFSKYSFEFQTITEAGEDTILYDEKSKIAVNKNDYTKEIFSDFGLDESNLDLKEAKSVEVGDIYSLGTKYSSAFNLMYSDKDGDKKPVFMGSYGIGVPRLMGTIVEVFNDVNGIIWPRSVAPFQVHLIELGGDDKDVRTSAKELYDFLRDINIEVLYDDRESASAGAKFADSDLIGIPYRVVVSKKTIEEEKFEIKERQSGKIYMIRKAELESVLKNNSI